MVVMLDVRITGGILIDGTGVPSRPADIGIRDGRVVTVGNLGEPARRTIDAEGRVVTPGFIDVHTHFDAQAFWDPTLSPSPLHGVTTIIGGNCGFSLTPLDGDSADYLMRMLARVEGMPLSALASGVPWDWTTTEEYLDRLEGTLAVNAGFMIGHSALRRVVLGDQAAQRPATADEVRRMQQLLRDGLAAGGLGFSSSWGASHQDGGGDPVPSRRATAAEIVGLAQICRYYPGTSLQFIPEGLYISNAERSLLADMSTGAGRPVNWNLILATATSLERHLTNLQTSTYAQTQGGKVVALAMPVDFPARMSFLNPFTLDGLPGWKEPMALPLHERLAFLNDPTRRRQLEDGASQENALSYVADWSTRVITETFSAANKCYEGRSVADIATEQNKRPFDALVDIACADKLATTFSRPPWSNTTEDWAARRRIWDDPRTLIGGSDAGAHLDCLATFNYPTHLLATVVRQERLFGLEDAVHKLTGAPAALYGLRDRGVLAPGSRADIVVFDADTIAAGPVATRYDLPGGGGRLYGGAIGVGHVLVNGVEIVDGGAFTSDRPGTILRSGRDTLTPAMN
jgi:N-acyl-D-aspartate/D-glutamate deacylase